MQYDTIILELLTRIKKLEDDVEQLKLNLSTVTVPPIVSDCGISSPVTYQKTTDEMIDACYKYGKRLVNGENAQILADQIAKETGMNRNSAVMYLYAVQGMLEGIVFKRAINAKAIQKYFDTIYSEYGKDGLRKALTATRLHIKYREDCGHTVDYIIEICNKNERRL